MKLLKYDISDSPPQSLRGGSRGSREAPQAVLGKGTLQALPSQGHCCFGAKEGGGTGVSTDFSVSIWITTFDMRVSTVSNPLDSTAELVPNV